jgi:hypothetical protein
VRSPGGDLEEEDDMKLKLAGLSCGAIAITAILAGPRVFAAPFDWGLFVQNQLKAHSWDLFGIFDPLDESALGPFTDPNSVNAIQLASPLHATLVSSAVHTSADMIAMWPDDDNPTHLYVCDESSSNPGVQRVDLSQPPASNATTIVTGVVSCDPIRRTPWGSIVFGEETTSGGFYELMNPASVVAPIAITNRAAGTTSDPRLVKRKAIGQLAFEGQVILPDGTMYFGDELAPGGGNAGGGIYKFVPDHPLGSPVTILNAVDSPFFSGTIFGLKVGVASNNGQGAEIGNGRWVQVDTAGAGVVDGNSNIVLRTAQQLQKFSGYYRPEDMDLDPLAFKQENVRVCWAATGRMSNGGGSEVETDHIYGEVMCLQDDDTDDMTFPTGTSPVVTRFIPGSSQAAMFDNLAFQPHTGNLVVLEDLGELKVVEGGVEKFRGDDIWMCLPDGDDDDVQTDGCIRIGTLKDTDAEPTGWIFTGSGRSAFVNIQHRGTVTPAGALLKITGFTVNRHHHDFDHGRDFFHWHGWFRRH